MSWPSTVLPSRNSTRCTATSSLALALSVIAVPTVPVAAAEIETVGDAVDFVCARAPAAG